MPGVNPLRRRITQSVSKDSTLVGLKQTVTWQKTNHTFFMQSKQLTCSSAGSLFFPLLLWVAKGPRIKMESAFLQWEPAIQTRRKGMELPPEPPLCSSSPSRLWIYIFYLRFLGNTRKSKVMAKPPSGDCYVFVRRTSAWITDNKQLRMQAELSFPSQSN